MVNPYPGERPGLVDELHQEIAFRSEQIAATRRAGQAFFVLPGEDGLRELAVDETAEVSDRAKAAELIAAHERYKRDVVEDLPALDSVNPYPAGASVSERFWPFVEHSHLFRNLDFWRKQHRLDINDWQSADHLQQSLDELLEELTQVTATHPYGDRAPMQRFICTPFERDPENCGMVLEMVSKRTIAAGLALLTRNTLKAVIVDTLTGDVIKIMKRTTFVVDLRKLNADYSQRGEAEYVRRMFSGIVKHRDGIRLNFDYNMHMFMEHLITDLRHEAIQPTGTVLFGFREKQPRPVGLSNPEALADYPVVAAAAAGVRTGTPWALEPDDRGLSEDEAYELQEQRRFRYRDFDGLFVEDDQL